MNKVKEQFVKTIEKGHEFILKTSSNAKNFCIETKDLFSIDSQIEEEIYNLGLAVYQEYKDKPKELNPRLFGSYFLEIVKLEEKKENIQKSLKNRFSQPLCKCCGEKLDNFNNFCSYCGTEVKKIKKVRLVKHEKVCTICGHKFETQDNYCGNCGKIRE